MRIFRIGQRVRRSVNDIDVPLGTLGTVAETPFGWTAPGDDEVYVNFDGYYHNPYRALEDCVDHAGATCTLARLCGKPPSSVEQGDVVRVTGGFNDPDIFDGIVCTVMSLPPFGDAVIVRSFGRDYVVPLANLEPYTFSDTGPIQQACVGDDSTRLRADNARLAESMAKLEYAVGMMREKIAEQQGIIAEQATELRKLRRR